MLRRKFGIIFQDYKLIPSRTVYENVALVLEAQGKKRSLIEKKVKSVLRVVRMEDRLTSLYRRVCPAVNSSGSLWPAPLPAIPKSSWLTNPPAAWMTIRPP
jgi:ABC-type ATPase involved in cell division